MTPTTEELAALCAACAGHTKGPWIQFADRGKTVAIMPAGRDGDICTFEQAPTDADASLMTIAPRLLDAIEALGGELADTNQLFHQIVEERDQLAEQIRLAEIEYDREGEADFNEYQAIVAERDSLRAELEIVKAQVDGYVERSVGAMAIAEGDEGYEKVPVDCPMLAAVSNLRAENAALAKDAGLPTHLLDVHAICDMRDHYRNLVHRAVDLIRDAPIHHYGQHYQEWNNLRQAFLKDAAIGEPKGPDPLDPVDSPQPPLT